jgi:2,5-diketo-D-gluconate reductase B
MAEAVKLSLAPFTTNQFEYHPYLNQAPLIEECRRLNLSVTAYCGMAVGRVFGDPVLHEIGKVHGKSVAQVVLRWLLQQHVIALSRTVGPDRVTSNIQVFDFVLTRTEVATLHGPAEANARIVNPAGLSPQLDPTSVAERLFNVNKPQVTHRALR